MVGDDALALGSLELIWASAYESGDDYLGDGTDIEISARWKGEKGKLVTALLEAGGNGSVGFIEEIPDKKGIYRIHDLWHHAPEYVRRRRKREAQRWSLTDPGKAIVQPVTSQGPASDQSVTNKTTGVTGSDHDVPTHESGLALTLAPSSQHPAPVKKDQEQKQVDAKRLHPRFTPPTIDQVREYCEARQNTVDPVRWHAFYTSNGWRVGRNPMKNWKAAVVTWERKEIENKKTPVDCIGRPI
jgi:hypothetical protein